MSEASRLLRVGDAVKTGYTGKITSHVITERKTGQSQSRVLFRVDPPLRTWRDTSNPWEEFPPWYDSDWFEPVKEQG